MAKRLLILDDDPLTGQTIRNIAVLAGLEVELTNNHRSFFAALEQSPPDVIALDLVMPDMDGVEVIAELGRRRCNCKIIITSGIGGRVLDAAGRSAIERGLDITGVLPKPFTPASLRELLAKATPAGSARKNGITLDDSFRTALGSSISALELQRAIDNGEIYLCYQPKVDCQTGTLSGFEALARWQHPIRGEVPPNDFIPLAEKSHLIDGLTREILDQALRWFNTLREGIRALQAGQSFAQDPNKFTLSINISALTLGNVQVFDRLNELCRDLDIQPQSLIFELTETSAMEDPVSSLELLTRLRLRGFRLSIDDFGTGYSSMLQLVKLPFSEIKVDKSFVITARESEESRVVIKSIVGLASNLGLIVTAEGIEDEETMGFLRKIGCTLVQGYYIARPMPGADVLPWLLSRAKGHEQRRLDALHALSILDTPDEARFDLLVRLACRVLKAPIAAFTLVDSERLWFKSRIGIPQPAVLRASSFCQHTIETGEMQIIGDLQAHPMHADNPMVMAPPHLRFYAGCPVRAADGSIIGSFILLDTVPRTLAPAEISVLRGLSALVESELYAQAHDSIDEVTRVFNRHALEAWLPNVLQYCRELALPCTLQVYELLELSTGPLSDSNHRNSYVLGNFARLLNDCCADADLIGRFDHDKFLVLRISNDEKSTRVATWKLESAVRAHNQHALARLDINYRQGLASAQPGGDYQLLSLLDLADQNMPEQ